MNVFAGRPRRWHMADAFNHKVRKKNKLEVRFFLGKRFVPEDCFARLFGMLYIFGFVWRQLFYEKF